MILRIILKNFLSFDDEVQFDMFPNLRRTQLSNHIYTNRGVVPVLKQAAIYGSNGAGKSNLVKALEFIRGFAIDKDFLKKIELQRFFYLLKDNATAEPISLAVEFEHQDRYFFYDVEIGMKGIVRETLSETFPKEERMELVYERRNSKVAFAAEVKIDKAIVDATQTMLNKNRTASLLSLNAEFPIVQDVRCKQALKWFRGHLEIIGVHTLLPSLIDLLHKDKAMMEFARKLVLYLEVGVNDINVVETDFDQWAQAHMELANQLPGDLGTLESLSLNKNNTPVLSINVEEGIKKVHQLIFNNLGKNGLVGHLDTSSQSDGTLRALTLLPALYCASRLNKTVVIDEINFCLSPTMVKGIVEFFAKSEDTNGQFIFTTHDTALMEAKDVLRSDEIWFVDKKEGASILYSHNDFKEHSTLSIQKGYNEGRYGAIRFVNLLNEHAKQ